MQAAHALIELPLETIEPHPFNVREELTPAALAGLAASIAERGLIHPILVRPHPDPERYGQYQLVCGSRRLAAYRLLHDSNDAGRFATIPARIEALDDTAALAAILQENELRRDWTAYERASFFRAVYQDAHFASIRKMAAAFGIGLTTLHRYLRVFDLPAAVISLFREGRLGLAQIEVVLEAPAAIQVELAKLLAERPVKKAEARRLARRLAEPSHDDWLETARGKLATVGEGVTLAAHGSGAQLTVQANDLDELRNRLKTLVEALG